MSDYAHVLTLLDSSDPVPRDDVRRWIDAGELQTWSAIYALLARAADRIHPALTQSESLEFTRRFLIRCIEENPRPGEHLLGGYQAAWALAARLKQWRKSPRSADVLRGIAIELERIYRRGDSATKNRILCGVLEHAFEEPALRPYFASWDRDEELKEAYKLAVDWGVTHSEDEH
ncbi:MAG TPA: hypothetical protein VN181_08960 [Thermoanaerobaculia bacterium]|nr:hypothetical protein [Thermoanaerobaculia bacterium]